MTWRIAIHDLDGSERIHDLPWTSFMFNHVLNAPGAVEITVSMVKVARADVEPGQSTYRIYQDSTLRAAGRLWSARVDSNRNTLQATLSGEGAAGDLTRRLIDWEARYEPVTEDPTNINTVYGMSQEDILWDMLERTQAESGGDLGITQGAHTGTTPVTRRRWYCMEDGEVIADAFDDFAGLSNGLDWAITPTLTDSSLLQLHTWCPARGTDRTGSITLDGTQYLDTLSYEIDAGQIVSRGHSVAEGDCEPPVGDVTDAGALAAYGLLEAFEGAQSDQADDATETATGLLSTKPVIGADLWYMLPEGPALGTFDVGDTIRITSPRAGWEFDLDARIYEVGVSVQLPDDDLHTFVRINWAEAA